jgi:hypothetical protein
LFKPLARVFQRVFLPLAGADKALQRRLGRVLAAQLLLRNADAVTAMGQSCAPFRPAACS